MAKRPIDGPPAGPGAPPLGDPRLNDPVATGFATPVFTPPIRVEFDEFDLDIKFDLGKLGHDFPVTGCLCLGATGLDTAAGATCGKFCIFSRNKLCLSNYLCFTFGRKTCAPCHTWLSHRLATCETCHSCFATCSDCGTQHPECG
jgi:hypothetical protein